MSKICCLALLTLLPIVSFAIDRGDYVLPSNKPKLIIIIDDLGDNYHLGKRVLELPVALNLAFLPNTPFASQLAEKAHTMGHDIMLHLPMEATTRPDLLGKGALVTRHNAEQAKAIFAQNLEQIPHVQGFNNHMGSRLTGSESHMAWVMEFASQKQLYFVDSRTAANSVAFRFAQQAGIPSLDRDIFLDPDKNPDTIARQWRRALELAEKTGQVVMIGHPYRETIRLLEKELPGIEGRFELVTLSNYWKPSDYRGQQPPLQYKLPVPALGDGENLSIGNLQLLNPARRLSL